jgi:uncharacterized protein YjiS (DUF1127 family)
MDYDYTTRHLAVVDPHLRRYRVSPHPPRATAICQIAPPRSARHRSPCYSIGVWIPPRTPWRSALVAYLFRLVATVSRWRREARARQGLQRLSDRSLDDIGLRRDQLECDTVRPFQHFD